MTTDRFKSYNVDGLGRNAMPLLRTDQLLVKAVPQPTGVALLMRSTPDATTGEPVESQWYLTEDQAKWLMSNLRNGLKDARQSRKSR